MPASMNSAQLDVQFGNWDIPSVTASSEASALSFTADLGASGHYGSAQHRYIGSIMDLSILLLLCIINLKFTVLDDEVFN